MNSIKDWLNSGRNYDEGLALYEVYGQDTALLKAFRQGESEYRTKRLVDAMRQLVVFADRPKLDDAPKKVVVTVNAEVLPEVEVDEKKDPYRSEWIPLYTEMKALGHTLLGAPDDVTRGKMAHKILRLERQCMAIWDKRNYFLRTGQHMIPEVAPTEVVTDKNMLHQAIVLYRSYISKAKKVAREHLDETRRREATDRIAKYTALLEDATKQLQHG